LKAHNGVREYSVFPESSAARKFSCALCEITESMLRESDAVEMTKTTRTVKYMYPRLVLLSTSSASSPLGW
jgi:hypothetical protein